MEIEQLKRENEMPTLNKICPTCKSKNVTRLKDGEKSFLPDDTTPHYICNDCGTLWGTGRPRVSFDDALKNNFIYT